MVLTEKVRATRIGNGTKTDLFAVRAKIRAFPAPSTAPSMQPQPTGFSSFDLLAPAFIACAKFLHLCPMGCGEVIRFPNILPQVI